MKEEFKQVTPAMILNALEYATYRAHTEFDFQEAVLAALGFKTTTVGYIENWREASHESTEHDKVFRKRIGQLESDLNYVKKILVLHNLAERSELFADEE